MEEILTQIAQGENQITEFKSSFQKETIKELRENNYISKTRNKLIALMFKECGLIEKYGSGISCIKKFCRVHNIMEPKFEEIQKGFRVTLYKKILSEKADVGVNVGVDTVFYFIKKYQPTKISVIAKHFDVTPRTIERYVRQLKEQDKIEFVGAPKTGGYYVK